MKKYVISLTFILCLIGMTFTGCAPKPNNEISDLALECFKQKKGITIKFEPQPENKQEQKID